MHTTPTPRPNGLCFRSRLPFPFTAQCVHNVKIRCWRYRPPQRRLVALSHRFPLRQWQWVFTTQLHLHSYHTTHHRIIIAMQCCFMLGQQTVKTLLAHASQTHRAPAAVSSTVVVVVVRDAHCMSVGVCEESSTATATSVHILYARARVLCCTVRVSVRPFKGCTFMSIHMCMCVCVCACLYNYAN